MKAIFRLLPHQVIPPSFLIVGAQKSATTSLHRYLRQHPLIDSPLVKEIRYFCHDANYEKGHQHYHNYFVYAKHPFRKKKLKDLITFEATPENLYFPFVPERIAAYKPDMKIIIALRNPVSRAYSAWNMLREIRALYNKLPIKPKRRITRSYQKGITNNFAQVVFKSKEFPSFEQMVYNEFKAIQQGTTHLEPSVVRRGIYHEQIERFYQYFDKDQVLILESNEIKSDLLNQLNLILTHIGLPPYHWNNLDATPSHTRKYVASMSEDIKQQLQTFYAPHNEKLYQMLGKNYNW